MHIEHIQLVQLLMRLSSKTEGKLPKYLVLKAQTNNSKDELVDKDRKELRMKRSVEYDYAFTE